MNCGIISSLLVLFLLSGYGEGGAPEGVSPWWRRGLYLLVVKLLPSSTNHSPLTSVSETVKLSTKHSILCYFTELNFVLEGIPTTNLLGNSDLLYDWLTTAATEEGVVIALRLCWG